MMRFAGHARIWGLVWICSVAACGSSEATAPLPRSNGLGPAPFDPGQTYAPRVAAEELMTVITNPLLPLKPGARWVYESTTDEGTERIEITVSSETQDVWGAKAVVVRDTASRDGRVIEDTIDWYAQDAAGNVWYMGEDTTAYANDGTASKTGSWRAGVNQALPGIVALASPQVGAVYRQEYLAGVAEDLAEVVSSDESVSVRAGSFTGCAKTRERSAVDLELDETKYYCPGVGTVLVEESDSREELIEYSGL